MQYYRTVSRVSCIQSAPEHTQQQDIDDKGSNLSNQSKSYLTMSSGMHTSKQGYTGKSLIVDHQGSS